MPVRRRDDRLPGPERIRKRSRNNLCLMAIRSDVDVCRANELNHFLWTDEAVVENHLRFHSYRLRQSLQAGTILVSLTPEDVRMSRACDHVNNVLVSGQNLRQSLNYIFNSLVRREQAERE